MNTLLAITGLGILVLLFEILNFRKGIVPMTVVGLLGVLALNIYEFNLVGGHYNNMIVIDRFATSFTTLLIVLTIFLIGLSSDFYKAIPGKLSDFIATKIFLLAGAIAMVSFGNLAMFFLGIEILSIALYVLAASNRLDIRSNEAGMKYFLMGSFASGFILFGICLIYGATGSFNVAEIHAASTASQTPEWFFIGLVMMIVGMLFKVAAVPFHFWAPDVYEGSPTLTTTLMSTLAKVVAIAALYKIASTLITDMPYAFEILIVIISIASMTVGNIMALRQTNVKRMLAFSGISHAGFMLMALLSAKDAGGTLLYYASAYALSGIAAFSVVIYIGKSNKGEDIINFNGLGKSHPLLAAILTGALLSMGGIPIFSGFFAKFMLFTETINAGYMVVVIAAVINSIISIGYYFKIILAMYTKESDEVMPSVPLSLHIVATVSILLNIAIGLFPSMVTDLLLT